MKNQEVRNAIVAWLSSYLMNSRCKGFVVGISGGVDSGLVSTLCAETGAPVIAVSLPIDGPSSENADSQLEFLETTYSNVRPMTIPLTVPFLTLDDLFNRGNELVMANLRSRLRMLSLYAIANQNNYLVVGTGNKVEDFGIGFFTKFGDGGVDISPIGDLLKSEVRSLAHFLKVPVADAIPTDGLWEDGRTDEDQIGATYDELEWALQKYELWERVGMQKFTNVEYTDRQRKVFDIFVKRHNSTLHKMEMPPICFIAKGLK